MFQDSIHCLWTKTSIVYVHSIEENQKVNLNSNRFLISELIFFIVIILPFLQVSSNFDSLDGFLTNWGRLPHLSEGLVAWAMLTFCCRTWWGISYRLCESRGNRFLLERFLLVGLLLCRVWNRSRWRLLPVINPRLKILWKKILPVWPLEVFWKPCFVISVSKTVLFL